MFVPPRYLTHTKYSGELAKGKVMTNCNVLESREVRSDNCAAKEAIWGEHALEAAESRISSTLPKNAPPRICTVYETMEEVTKSRGKTNADCTEVMVKVMAREATFTGAGSVDKRHIVYFSGDSDANEVCKLPLAMHSSPGPAIAMFNNPAPRRLWRYEVVGVLPASCKIGTKMLNGVTPELLCKNDNSRLRSVPAHGWVTSTTAISLDAGVVGESEDESARHILHAESGEGN